MNSFKYCRHPLLQFIFCILVISIFSITVINAQGIEGNGSFEKIKSFPELKKKLTSESLSEMEKAQIIYSWIGKSVRYDFRTFQKHKFLNYTPSQVIRRKKGLCSEFSRTFVYLGKLAGIKAFEVEGYLKESDYLKDQPLLWSNHSWVLFKAEGEYYLADPTFGSGYIAPYQPFSNKLLKKFFPNSPVKIKYRFIREFNSAYFAISPHSLIRSHLPESSFYQLTPSIVPLKSFIEEKIQIDSSGTSTGGNEEVFAIENNTELDRIIIQSKKAYEYNPGNNFTMVKPYFLSASSKILLMNSINNSSALANKKKETSKDLAFAERFNNKFINDLGKIKAFRIDVFTKRTNYLKSNLNSLLDADLLEIKNIPNAISILKAENIRIRKTIQKEGEGQSNNYLKIAPKNRNIDNDSASFKIKKNRSLMGVNMDSITIYETTLNQFEDSLASAQDLEYKHFEEIIRSYYANQQLIKNIILQTAERKEIVEFEVGLKEIMNNKKVIKKSSQKPRFEKSVMMYQRKINRLASENINLIRQNIILGGQSLYEDSLMNSSGKTISNFRNYLLNLNQVKLQDNQQLIVTKQIERKLLKKEKRLLKQALIAEKNRYRSDTLNENLKYTRYLKRAKEVEKLIKKGEQFLAKF